MTHLVPNKSTHKTHSLSYPGKKQTDGSGWDKNLPSSSRAVVVWFRDDEFRQVVRRGRFRSWRVRLVHGLARLGLLVVRLRLRACDDPLRFVVAVLQDKLVARLMVRVLGRHVVGRRRIWLSRVRHLELNDVVSQRRLGQRVEGRVGAALGEVGNVRQVDDHLRLNTRSAGVCSLAP